MPHRPTLVIAVLAAAVAPAAAQDVVILTPEKVGEMFCIAALGNDMAAIGGLLTPGLAAAIADAEARDAAWASAHPGDKPPLGDGIPWQEVPDYAATCTVGAVAYMMDEATVKVTHGFPEYPQADFTDTLWLRLVADAAGVARWRIDNLVYAGGSDLRMALRSAFMDN